METKEVYHIKNTAEGQESTVTSCSKGNSSWIQGKKILPCEWFKVRQVAQKCCVISILGDCQDVTEQIPEQSELAVKSDLLEARG